MIRALLGLNEPGEITRVEWLMQSPWLAGAAMVLAAAYVAVLYRRERALTRPRRTVLASLRAVALAAVVLLVFRPVVAVEMIAQLPRTLLVLLDTSDSMNRRDRRSRESDLVEAARALGKVPFARAPNALPAETRAQVAAFSRLELARGILRNADLKLIERLGKGYELRFFRFGESLRPEQGKGDPAAGPLRDAKAADPVTRLGSAVEEAVARYAGRPIAGAIVLTDGASNAGRDPLDAARALGRRNVPLFPVGLGLAEPPDVRIGKLIVQETVFHKDRVPVRVQVRTTGLGSRTVRLDALLDGVKVAGKVIALRGPSQFEELEFVPERRGGTARLEVRVQPVAGEATAENNTASRTLRILDEKIKVLYVEGLPRWEYRYLRRVLLRDHRLDVTFLLTRGDRELAEQTDNHLADFPSEAAEAFAFDLVILGDVPAGSFVHSQMARMAELVKAHGGSFLMIAGEEHAPGTYVRTPLADLLPVRLGAEKWQDLDRTVHPKITAAGQQSTVTSLASPEARNQEVWSKVQPLHKVPLLDGAKPAATVLAELTVPGRGGEPYPLIAWQRYGSGKSMFIGTDQLWRLRFMVGDRYHARFWGQAIQFLTLSRLLGENKRIRLETDRTQYRQGERMEISANVLNENFDPVRQDGYTVRLVPDAGRGEAVPVRLEPVPGIDGLYQGFHVLREPGRYALLAPEADARGGNRVELLVEPATLEQLDPAMQEALLREMAAASGGRYFAIGDLPALPEAVRGERRTTFLRRERELWDVWAVFVVVLALLSVEWFVRRRSDLI